MAGNIEEKCENCIHERDSGHEYCGSCDLISQFSPKADLLLDAQESKYEDRIKKLRTGLKIIKERVDSDIIKIIDSLLENDK